MTDAELIRIAREAGFGPAGPKLTTATLRAMRAAVEAEREACAGIAQVVLERETKRAHAAFGANRLSELAMFEEGEAGADEIADAIRARGEGEG